VEGFLREAGEVFTKDGARRRRTRWSCARRRARGVMRREGDVQERGSAGRLSQRRWQLITLSDTAQTIVTLEPARLSAMKCS